MICLALGLGALGFFAMRKARRCRGYGHGFGHHWHRHHHHGRRRWMVHAALARIDASPAQERAIIAELEKLEDRVYAARRNLTDTRSDLAAAVRNPQLDDAALGAVLGKADASTSEVRAAMIETLRAIHGHLDDGQRAQVADLIDRRGGGMWRSGPYR